MHTRVRARFTLQAEEREAAAVKRVEAQRQDDQVNHWFVEAKKVLMRRLQTSNHTRAP